MALSQSEPSPEPIHLQITGDRAHAWELLHRLATDEAFYHHVKENPQELFGEQGCGVPGQLVPEAPIDLPPRSQIQDFLDQIDDPFVESARPPVGMASVYMLAIAWGGPAPPGPPGPG